MAEHAILTALTADAPPPDGITCLAVRTLGEADIAAIEADCANLVAHEPYSSPAKPDHPTAWTRPSGDIRQYSLLTASGRCDDASRDHDHSCFGKRFWPAPDYPALARLLDAVPHCVNARLNWLGPGARLQPHREAIAFHTTFDTVAVKARFHLPVQTNPDAGLMVRGDWHHLEPGTLYLVNNGQVHSAANDGPKPRWHLVFDCLLTSEVLAALIAQAGEPPSPFRLSEQVTPHVIRRERVTGVLAMAEHVTTQDKALVELAPVQ
ncbi:MAG: hypothetical protein QOE53_2043 [Pseudonocardiales bacterium]|jgi:hypothetical protein|nr:hypothetical protein [Pseudonocardiales bacterium]